MQKTIQAIVEIRIAINSLFNFISLLIRTTIAKQIHAEIAFTYILNDIAANENLVNTASEKNSRKGKKLYEKVNSVFIAALKSNEDASIVFPP
jgi:hypothetical protein